MSASTRPMAISDCVALDALRVDADLKGIAFISSQVHSYPQSIIIWRISDYQGIIRIYSRTTALAVAADVKNGGL
jgi:hypothetical protein